MYTRGGAGRGGAKWDKVAKMAKASLRQKKGSALSVHEPMPVEFMSDCPVKGVGRRLAGGQATWYLCERSKEEAKWEGGVAGRRS